MSIHKRAKDMGVSDLVKRLEKLEKENRELREKLAEEGIRMDMMNHYNEIKEENEKMREENKKLSEENGQLKEKIETLELRLDNKEKLNELYRKQLDKLRTDNIYEEGLYD